MFLQIIIFIVGLIILFFSSDKLIEAAVSLGKHLNVSNVFIGLTVIAFGTSLPEFFVSYMAMSKGSSGISIGNIIGSNIANITLLIGAVGIVFPLKFNDFLEAEGLKKKAILMTFFYVVLILVSWDGAISRFDGFVFLIFFIIFLWKSFKGCGIEPLEEDAKQYTLVSSIRITIVSLIGLILGANIMTDAAVVIATILGVKDYIIGATIVAVGTSLPELAASFSAIKKGEFGMSLANIIGSNIFNILMVLGFISVFFTIPVEIDVIKVDYAIMLLTAIILITCVSKKNNSISAWAIYLSVIVYAGYLFRLILLAIT